MTKKAEKSEDVIDAEYEPVIEPSKDNPSQSPTNARARQAKVGPLIWVLFVLATGAGGAIGLFAQPFFTPKADNSALLRKVIEQETQIADLSAQLSSLAAQDPSTPNVQVLEDIQNLTNKMTAVQAVLIEQAEAPELLSDAQISNLTTRLDALEARPIAGTGDANAQLPDLEPFLERLSVLENTPAPVLPEPVTLPDNLNARLLQLETQQAEPQAQIDPQLITRIENLESSLTHEIDGVRVTQSASRSVALANLKHRLTGSGAFLSEYLAARQAFGSLPEILAVENTATTGALTLSQLQTRLQNQIPIWLTAARKPDDSASLLTKAGAGLRGLVSVRRTDGKGTPLEIALANAETAMLNADLVGAVATIQGLPQISELSSNWVQSAEQRIAIQQLIQKLDQQMQEATP